MTNNPKQRSLNKVLLNGAGLGCESGHVAGFFLTRLYWVFFFLLFFFSSQNLPVRTIRKLTGPIIGAAASI